MLWTNASALQVLWKGTAWVTRRIKSDYDINCVVPCLKKLSVYMVFGAISGNHGVGNTIHFKVLEATGNFTEAPLKGGGFYSLEGFPFRKHLTSRSSA
jgi:hypothetical protein